jgi:hypothetical protein
MADLTWAAVFFGLCGVLQLLKRKGYEGLGG